MHVHYSRWCLAAKDVDMKNNLDNKVKLKTAASRLQIYNINYVNCGIVKWHSPALNPKSNTCKFLEFDMHTVWFNHQKYL